VSFVGAFAATVRACAELAAPGGHLFFATINRNLKAYLLAVVGAEYVLRLLPRGTHDYARFIKPSELARMLRHAGLELVQMRGMGLDLASRSYHLSGDVSVNYLMACRREH